MTRNFTLDSDPYDVREALKDILILITETLEGATPIVLESISRQGLDFSPFLFSTSIRCHIKKALTQGGFNPQDLSEPQRISLNWVSNDGIEFDEDVLRIKVLKGPSLPRATSSNRSIFYSQQGSFDFQRDSNSTAPLRSLVVLWDYNIATSELSFLLVAPKNSNGEILWQVPLPSPAEWIIPRDILEDRDVDLPIEDDEEEKGEQG